MRQLTAFIKKECMEVIRTGKFTVLMIVFILFGVMNPAMAKITPWLLESMSDSLSDAGFMVTEVEVDALTSWTQFYKNVPMALIVFLLMFSGILTVEYQKGTLINMITKGLARWKVIAAKFLIMLGLWTIGYWMCYGITYAYNEYFWDNSIAKDVMFAAFCFYFMGVWLIALVMLMSVVFSSNSAVAVGTGAGFFLCYLVGMLPDVREYLPIRLMDGLELLSGIGKTEDYMWALAVTAILTVGSIAIAVVGFNKKNV